MLTLILTFVSMPVLVFLGLTVQWWLFRNEAWQNDPENDPEWKIYRQRYD